jgi:alkylated DNA repair protein alkB homolog 6
LVLAAAVSLSLHRVADWISPRQIASAPKPRWKQLTHRRLQTWPSDLVKNALLDAPLPQWLTDPIISRLLELKISEETDSPNIFTASPHGHPNHVLINEYPPGVGIMPHKDGAAYHPVVCTVSLGASLCLDLYQSKDDGALDTKPVFRILQEPRSLLITTEDLYTEYLHGIADVDEDIGLSAETIANWDLLRNPAEFADGRNLRKTRTSLTYRDVMKVSKLGSRLGMFGKR